MGTAPKQSLLEAYQAGFRIERPLTGTQREALTARLLILLDYPRNVARDFRKKVGLKTLYAYPKEASTFIDFDDFLYDIDEKVHDEAFKAAEKVVLRYELTFSWVYPFMVAMLTNHLPLLPDPGIRLHTLESTPIKQLGAFVGRNIAAHNQSVLIEITRQVKPEDLRRFIYENQKTLTQALKKLPARPVPKLEERAYFWGYMASIVKRDNPSLTWQGTFKYLMDVFENERTPTPPDTSTELRLLHHSYVGVRSRFE